MNTESMKEIHVVLSVIGGQAQHELQDKIFGKDPIPEKEGWYKLRSETTIGHEIKIKQPQLIIREAALSYQDILTIIEIVEPYTEEALTFLAGYLASKLLDYAKSKIKIGNNEVPITKEDIKNALKDALEEKDEEKKE